MREHEGTMMIATHGIAIRVVFGDSVPATNLSTELMHEPLLDPPRARSAAGCCPQHCGFARNSAANYKQDENVLLRCCFTMSARIAYT